MKKIIAIVLLLFVGASIVKLVLNECQKTYVGDSTELADAVEGTKTVVYYFHGNVRCTTCNTIEANTNKAMGTGFSKMLASGDMLMRVVNMDDPVNEHYVTDYKLTNSSVVVSQVNDGAEVKWVRLDEAWDLVSDEALFIEYIQKEIRAVMKGEG